MPKKTMQLISNNRNKELKTVLRYNVFDRFYSYSGAGLQHYVRMLPSLQSQTVMTSTRTNTSILTDFIEIPKVGIFINEKVDIQKIYSPTERCVITVNISEVQT